MTALAVMRQICLLRLRLPEQGGPLAAEEGAEESLVPRLMSGKWGNFAVAPAMTCSKPHALT